MHVSSKKQPIEIKGRDNVLSVGRIFLYRKLIHVERINLLQDCAVILEVNVVCAVRFTQVVARGPKRNYARK